MVVDRRPDDCNHEKTLLTLDNGEETERVCIVCNDVNQVTLDEQ